MPGKKNKDTVIAQNRKARHDYDVEDTYEAGLVLTGTEIKSIRSGAVNLKDSYCRFDGRNLVVCGMHVSPYDHGNIFNTDPLRDRVLLMHAREIRKLDMLRQKEGYSLVPLDLHFSGSRAKLTIAVCRGRKNYDKREATARRDAARDIDRAMKAASRRTNA